MAGIGFELKKIFKERSIIGLLKGAFYSTFTIIGPMLLIIVGFLALNIILGYESVPYEDRDLFVSIVLYVFVFSLIVTSPFSAVISRYVADKIFEEKIEDILPCYYSGLLMNLIFGLILCVPFAVVTVIKGNVDPLLMFVSSGMYVALMLVFYNLTFISALKEYKSISITFTVGVVIAVALSLVLHLLFHWGYAMAVITGAAIGFTFIAFILLTLVKRFFVVNSNKYKEFFVYFRRHKLLFLTNLCYILGLYVHNFVFWIESEFKIVVAKTLVSAPVYDTATFLAMLTGISSMVIFTVRVETNFHERYQAYCQEIIGGIGTDIAKAERNMFKILAKELLYIAGIQMILTIAVFLIVMMFGPSIGFGGILLNIYPALAAGYLVMYLMYCLIIFLYYFDDGLGAFISSAVFVVCTAIGAVLAKGLPVSYYGIGPFIGAIVAWSVAYFRLSYIEKHLSMHLFCRGSIVGTKTTDGESLNTTIRFDGGEDDERKPVVPKVSQTQRHVPTTE